MMGLDVGERWVGVAVSDPLGIVVRPLQALERSSKAEDFAAIADLVAEYEVTTIVVGCPVSLDGTEGPQAQRVDAYVEALVAYLAVHEQPVDVVMWDERYTTVEAEEIMRQQYSEKARRRARSNGQIDAIAAAVILQSYLVGR